VSKEARRKLIAKLVRTRKQSASMKEAWQRKKRYVDPDAVEPEDAAGRPETDTALDELPEGLVG